MKGYVCDGCGNGSPGIHDQRDGELLPRDWVTVNGARTGHLCGDCIATVWPPTSRPR